MNCRVPASKRYQPTDYEHAANCATHGVSQESTQGDGHFRSKSCLLSNRPAADLWLLCTFSIPDCSCAFCVLWVCQSREGCEKMERIARNEAEYGGFLAMPQRQWAIICDSACSISLICCNPCALLPPREKSEWVNRQRAMKENREQKQKLWTQSLSWAEWNLFAIFPSFCLSAIEDALKKHHLLFIFSLMQFKLWEIHWFLA